MPNHESEEQLGPIDFVAVEFPDGHPSQAGFDVLLDLADRGVIRVLDAEFVVNDPGGARVAEPGEIAGLETWDGAYSGLLDADDVDEIAAGMAPGGVAAVVVFENVWVTRLIDAWRGSGARLIAEGGLPAADISAALDASEPA